MGKEASSPEIQCYYLCLQPFPHRSFSGLTALLGSTCTGRAGLSLFLGSGSSSQD